MGWLFPLDTGVSVGIGAPSLVGKQLFPLFQDFLALLNRTYGTSIPCRQPQIWHLPAGGFPRPLARGNVLLVGDAAGFVDPFSGEGIYWAVNSGITAANLAIAYLAGKLPGSLAQAYSRECRKNAAGFGLSSCWPCLPERRTSSSYSKAQSQGHGPSHHNGGTCYRQLFFFSLPLTPPGPPWEKDPRGRKYFLKQGRIDSMPEEGGVEVGKGKGWPGKLALLVRAVRAPFLAASAIPVLVGTSAALYETGTFLGGCFILNLLGVVFLHCSANVANDYYDYLSGADPSHPPYPFHGGSQVIQEGLMTPDQVRRLFQLCFLLAAICGGWLVLLRGPLVLLPGLAGAFCGYFYTAPPLQFAYRGLGEITTGITFGPLVVLGTYYVQTQTFALTPLVASLPLGFLIAAVPLSPVPHVGEDGGRKGTTGPPGRQKARPGLFVLWPVPLSSCREPAGGTPPLALLSF